MVRQAFLVSCLLLLTAAGYDKKFHNILRTLKDQPLSAAVDLLGLPENKMEMGDLTVYTWVEGNVISGWDVIDGDETTPLSCAVKLSVDKSDLIRWMEWRGNNAACKQMYKRVSGNHKRVLAARGTATQ